MTSHFATDVIPPQTNLNWSLMGWGEQTQSEPQRKYAEAILLEQAVEANPQAFAQRDQGYVDPTFLAKWNALQESKGYDAGSCDLTLMDELFFGRRFLWKIQKTGSCTISNTFRPHVRRQLYEIGAKGQLEVALGDSEFTENSISFYAPISYGIAREHGNLRRGDGGFCSTTIESLQEGIIRCNDGDLLALLQQLNATAETDFPEPQNNNVYRAFQDWRYNNKFRPLLKYPLVESVVVRNVGQLVDNAKMGKPTIQCSMLAVKKGGTFQGLQYFVADRNNTWAHCMSWQGFIIWKGRHFDLLSNESWPGGPIYPMPREEVEDTIFPRYRPECQTLGEIDLADATIAS